MIVKVFLGFWLMNSVPSFRDSVSRKKLATARKPKGTQSAATTFGLSTLLEIVTPKIIDKFFFEKPQPVKLWNYLLKFWGAFFLSTRKKNERSEANLSAKNKYFYRLRIIYKPVKFLS